MREKKNHSATKNVDRPGSVLRESVASPPQPPSPPPQTARFDLPVEVDDRHVKNPQRSPELHETDTGEDGRENPLNGAVVGVVVWGSRTVIMNLGRPPPARDTD